MHYILSPQDRYPVEALLKTTYRYNATGEQWCYCYDGSGRRTEKRCDTKKLRTTYLWDGDSIAEIREYRDDTLYSVRHLVFSGFELLSQQYSRSRQAHPTEPVRWVTRTSHAVSELTGRPLMFFNSTGDVVRRPAETTLWGRLIAAVRDDGTPRRPEDEEADPGMLYAGQWRDAESGLCYNRFRYYEPESGMYLVSDPLGLGGGEQTYRYVGNPCGWVDVYGLAGCPRALAGAMNKANRELAKGSGYMNRAWYKFKGSAAHHIVAWDDPRAATTRKILEDYGIHIDSAENGIFLKHIDPHSLQPGTYHRIIHTNKYYSDVERRIVDAAKINGKQGVLDELNAIRDDLLFNNPIY